MRYLFPALVAGGWILLGAGPAFAQQAAVGPPAIDEHYGFGGVAALGRPGPVVAIRASAPLAPRFGVDLDVGLGRESRQATAVYAAQLRWLRTARRKDGTSDYGIIGFLVMDDTFRSTPEFPETSWTEKRRKRVSAQIGYGVDLQTRGGTRVGFELAGGGMGGEALDFRLFAKAFAVWGRPVAPGRIAESTQEPRPGPKTTCASRAGSHGSSAVAGSKRSLWNRLPIDLVPLRGDEPRSDSCLTPV